MLIIIICLLSLNLVFKFKFKSLNLRVTIKIMLKNVNFPTQFCLGSISKRFSATESREISLSGHVYNFSID